MVTHSIS